MRIVVAMSGGVDSSTAAGLLVEAGHEVIGLAMKTHEAPARTHRACCTPDDLKDARRVADHLGIPFYVLNYAELFKETVVRPFAEAYRAGRTPNPCIECNDKVKFRPLLARAQILGAQKLATGHYARIGLGPSGAELWRGVDRDKDQSYFLHRLDRTQLSHLLFPVGGLRKPEVRAHATRLGLPVAQKSESMEICFVGAAGYGEVVEKEAGPGRAGEFLDKSGRVVGHHAGVHHFTLGQRRGLRLAHEHPLYVTAIDAESGVVRVGPREELLSDQVSLQGVHFVDAAPPEGSEVEVQQRYREPPRRAKLYPGAHGQVVLRFAEG